MSTRMILFAPGGNVSADSLHLLGAYTGVPRKRLTLSGSGTGACAAEPGAIRPLCIADGNFYRAGHHDL
jgi:hypothetical protein